MKKLLLALTLALLPLQAWAQGVVTNNLNTTNCAVGGCLALGVEGYGSATVQLVVAGTATAVVEGSVNGTAFRTLQISASDGSGNVTSATATGMWYVNVGGLSQVRIRLSTCTSCNVLAYIQGSRSGGGASGGGAGGGDATAANQSTQITSLQLIDDLVLAQGSTTSGQVGALGLAAVTTSAPTYTNGQTSPLSLDTNGALRVSGAGGGTQYTQDAALTVATTVGTMATGRASAAAPSDVSADNDAVIPWYLRSGAEVVQPSFGGILATTGNGVAGTGVQRVTIASDSTGVVALTTSSAVIGHVIVDSGGGGGTQYTQDAALTVGSSIVTMAGGRASAAVPTDVSADNDAVMPWYLRSGAQAIQPTYAGVLATTGNGVAGTGVPRVTIASDSTGVLAVTESGTWNITNVSGTVSLPTGAATAANQSTEITALQLIDNIPNTLGSTTSGQSGVLGLGAVTTSAPTYTTAQSNALSLQTDGSLRVAITNGASGGVSVADNATFTDNTSNITPIGGPAEIASPTTCTEGKFCGVATTLNRGLKVVLYGTDGTALTPSQDQTEDAASAGGETGPMILSVRRDTRASSAGTTGDFATINTDSTGGVWVNPFGVTQAAATYLTVRLSDGTNFLQSAADQVEDAASAGGESGPMILGVMRTALASSSSTTGDFATFNLNSLGGLYVQPTAGISGGASGLAYTSAGSTEDEHEVKSSAGILYSIAVTNTNAAVRYLRCADQVIGSNTPGTTTPVIDLAIPGQTTGAGFTTSFPVGYQFSTGLTCWTVTGAARSDVAEVASNEIKIFYTFK